MKKQENLTVHQRYIVERALKIVANGEWSINVQTTHPEQVKEEVLDMIEASADEVLCNIHGPDLEEYADDIGDDNDEFDLLTIVADRKCNHYNTETTTPVVGKFSL